MRLKRTAEAGIFICMIPVASYHLEDPTKNVDGSWECTATFDPDRSILRWLFGGFRSQSTSIGVYRAGETIRRTDKNGSTYEYGFSVNKMGISWN